MDVIQSIFQQEFNGLRNNVSLDQLKAASNIVACRTGRLGGRVYSCPSGEEGHDGCVMYNSCHYRHCPQCNTMPRARWLEKYQSKLLNCGHRQVVFTVPHELNKLWLYNKKELSGLFFSCVSKTLKTFILDPKWLGATAGYSLILHTWGRNLSLHPHIHAVITEGGFNSDGVWVEPNHKDYLPAVAMMHKFRGAYISGIRKLIRAEQLKIPEGETETQIKRILNRVYTEKKWNVKVEKGYSHGRGIMKYLSRYLKGGPIKRSQVKVDLAVVKLRYKDHRSGLMKYQKFSKPGFIKQLLVHIPPTAMPMIRHYGLYAAASKVKRERAAKSLPVVKSTFNVEQYLESIGIVRSDTCSVCESIMQVRELRTKEYVH